METRSYDRSFYEWAISQCRSRKLFDELDEYRIALSSRFVMRPGEFMEWLADNQFYEENLSEKRLSFLIQACADLFSTELPILLPL